jgi:alcohol dehydrogenase (cytochrome c)
MNKRWLMSSVAALGALALSVPAQANDGLLSMQDDDKQWVMQLGDYASTRYSTLNEINKDNVGDLQVAWTFSTGVLRGHEGGPLVIGDVMYVHTPFPNIVYALDLNDNARVIWKYEPKQDPDVIPVMCCDTVNRGVAYADDTIFLHQADTTLVALDAATGEVKWSVANGDPSKGETGTSTPMVIKDKVLVGISGGAGITDGRCQILQACFQRMNDVFQFGNALIPLVRGQAVIGLLLHLFRLPVI